MKILDLLKGRKVKVMTDAMVEVVLEIKEAVEKNHSIDLEPSTAANDWYPATKDWNTIEVTFTNGFRKSYKSVSELEII